MYADCTGAQGKLTNHVCGRSTNSQAINNLNALRAHLPENVVDGLSKKPVR